MIRILILLYKFLRTVLLIWAGIYIWVVSLEDLNLEDTQAIVVAVAGVIFLTVIIGILEHVVYTAFNYLFNTRNSPFKNKLTSAIEMDTDLLIDEGRDKFASVKRTFTSESNSIDKGENIGRGLFWLFKALIVGFLKLFVNAFRMIFGISKGLLNEGTKYTDSSGEKK